MMEVLTKLAKAPDSQLDHELAARIEGLTGKEPIEIARGAMDVLNESVAFGQASGFVVATLDVVTRAFCQEYGLNWEEIRKQSIKQLEARYNNKWDADSAPEGKNGDLK